MNDIAYWAERWRDIEQAETDARLELKRCRSVFKEKGRLVLLAQKAEREAGNAATSAAEYLRSRANETAEAAKRWAEAKAKQEQAHD